MGENHKVYVQFLRGKAGTDRQKEMIAYAACPGRLLTISRRKYETVRIGGDGYGQTYRRAAGLRRAADLGRAADLKRATGSARAEYETAEDDRETLAYHT
jgi:hypothetical protein